MSSPKPKGYEIEGHRYGVKPGTTFVTQALIDVHGSYRAARRWMIENHKKPEPADDHVVVPMAKRQSRKGVGS